MNFVIKGKVVDALRGSGVFGITVNLIIIIPKSDEWHWIYTTDRTGTFSFLFLSAMLEKLKKNKAEAFLRVTDRRGEALYQSERLDLSGEPIYLDITLKASQLREADIPKPLTGGGVVPQEIFDAIDQAMWPAEGAGGLPSMKTAAENYYCGLPPIQRFGDSDILQLAENVLAGHSRSIRLFREYLDNFELWNRQHLEHAFRQLSTEEAEYLLSDKFMQHLRQRIAPPSDGTIAGIIPVERVQRLMFAAVQVAGSDPVQINRNLGIIDAQICGLDSLGRLYSLARQVSSGGPAAINLFTHTLSLFGGGCGPQDGPLPGGTAGPLTIPCERNFWPPLPKPGGDPVPGEWEPEIPPRAEMWACLAEGVPRWNELAGLVRYGIESIEPANACPGDEITITGSNFLYEGNAGVVRFPGPGRSTIEVEPDPGNWNENSITVIVPEGAHCGDIELYIPEARLFIPACGEETEIFLGPKDPFPFEGGETAIIRFDIINEKEECWHSGEEVRLSWQVCNSTSQQLEVTIQNTGDILVREEFVSPDGFDGYTFIIPELADSSRLVFRLAITGPCGDDSRTLRIDARRSATLSSEDIVPFHFLRHWENWHHELGRHFIRRTGFERNASPAAHLSHLLNAVQTAEMLGEKLGVQGSGWSYMDCVIPTGTDLLLDTDNLNNYLTGLTDAEGQPIDVIPSALRDEEQLRSILPEDTLERIFTESLPLKDRLVHVEGGIKLYNLNCLLDEMELAMPTLGGANGQSIAGATATSTHGANPDLPPIVDFIRAIHLVGNGGQQWWIEPARNPITERYRMEDLARRRILDPCIKIVYDDNLFDACLVSFGTGGVIYSVVIEAVRRHYLEKEIRETNWTRVRSQIQRTFLDRSVTAPWFFEVSLNPTRVAWLTTYSPVPPPTDEGDASGDLGHPSFYQVLSDVLEGGELIARIADAIPGYIAERSLELLNPFNASRFDEIREDIRLFESALEAMTGLLALFDVHHFHRRGAELLVEVLNLLWKLGSRFSNGREIVERIQNVLTGYLRIPTSGDGAVIAKSYRIMTNQKDCLLSDYEIPDEHSELEKLIDSHEYIFPEDRGLEFVDELLRLADSIRSDKANDGFILIINLRFTLPSRALLAMQQYNRSFHVEIWTVKGMDANENFYRQLRPLAATFQGIPHWGHYHDPNRDYGDLYNVTDAHSGRRRDKLALWRREMGRLATEGGSSSMNTFRHAFALERGLLRLP